MPSWIFNGYIGVSVATAAGVQALENSSFLATVDLFSEPYKVLLVHHPLKRKQWASGLLLRINPLAHCCDIHIVEPENLNEPQEVRCIAR